MFKPRRRAPSAEKPVVFSWLAQVEWQQEVQRPGSFQLLVRHLFARLLSSTSLDASDNASASWHLQAAYAAALPTLLFALYLFPAYHQPFAKPAFWVQASHHLFFVSASYGVMGLTTVLLWDALFPDVLDVLILAHLPIKTVRLLAARVVAIAILLGGILVETSFLGILFFPAVADLPLHFPVHFVAHAVAVLGAGLCAISTVVALQGALICCCGRRLAAVLSPVLQAASVLFFTFVLVLEPVFASLLLPSRFDASRLQFWFPPFWFLGLYEHLLVHTGLAPAFHRLASVAFAATALVTVLALVTYPVAHTRRIREALEGTSIPKKAMLPPFFTRLLSRTPLQDGRRRAIFYWVSQTILRTRRTLLLLAFFTALVLALPLSMLVLRFQNGGGVHPLLLQIGRLAIPAAAFLIAAGLRAALRSAVAQKGAWAFRALFGKPGTAHLSGASLWVTCCGCVTTVLLSLVVHAAYPSDLRQVSGLLEQCLIGVALSILTTDLLFLQERAIPFTTLRVSTVNDISVALVSCFVLFPIAALALVAVEPWFESSPWRWTLAIPGCAILHLTLLWLRARGVAACRGSDMEEDELLPGEIGLRS